MSNLWDVKAVAEYLAISASTVYRYAERNELPHIKKFGLRFKKEDIDEFLEKDKRKNISLFSLPLDKFTAPPVSLIEGGGIFEVVRKSKSKTRFCFGYGAIYQRKTKRGKARWYLDYRDADGRRVQKVATHAITKEEAALALREEVARAFDREYSIKRKKEKMRFKEFAEIYLRDYSMVKKRAWERSDKVYLHANLVPYFGNIELTKIDTHLIERFIAKRLESKVKKSTINRDLTCMKKMFNKAVDWDYLRENPANKVKMFSEKDNRRDRILSEEEETRLLKTSSRHLKSILVVALNTGARMGEILNLQWTQIDFKAMRIKVEKTKSGKIRFINVNVPLFKELLKLKRINGQNPYVFFNPKTGKPLTSVKTAFKAACRRAGIKGLRMHDMRRSFATRLLQKGADIETVRSLLGHRSILTTQRYTHTDDDRKKRAVELLNGKPKEIAKNGDSLLPIRYTEKEGQKAKEATDLFSVN